MTRWGIFKCQNCGKKFKEKFVPEGNWQKRQEIDPEHIGRYTHIVSTHRCKDGTYGCGKLIGCEVRQRKRAPADAGKRSGEDG